MTEEEIKQTELYSNVVERISHFPELRENIASELKIAFDSYKGVGLESFDFSVPLGEAFIWALSPQKDAFWENVYYGGLPKEYR